MNENQNNQTFGNCSTCYIFALNEYNGAWVAEGSLCAEGSTESEMLTTTNLDQAWTIYAVNHLHAVRMFRAIFKIKPEVWVGACEYSVFQTA